MLILGRTTTYSFLVTEDVLPGPLGRIEIPTTSCRTTFRSRRLLCWNRITVNRDTGIVRLNTRFKIRNKYNGIKNLTTNILVTTRCGSSVSRHVVTVKLFIFRKSFGDSFLRSYIPRLDNMVKENKKFDIQKGMATSLHRIMRMVFKEKNPETFNEMMASAKVDIALDAAINKIVEKHVTHSSGNYPI